MQRGWLWDRGAQRMEQQLIPPDAPECPAWSQSKCFLRDHSRKPALHPGTPQLEAHFKRKSFFFILFCFSFSPSLSQQTSLFILVWRKDNS